MGWWKFSVSLPFIQWYESKSVRNKMCERLLFWSLSCRSPDSNEALLFFFFFLFFYTLFCLFVLRQLKLWLWMTWWPWAGGFTLTGPVYDEGLPQFVLSTPGLCRSQMDTDSSGGTCPPTAQDLVDFFVTLGRHKPNLNTGHILWVTQTSFCSKPPALELLEIHKL